MYRTILFLGVISVAAATPIVISTVRSEKGASFFDRFLSASREKDADATSKTPLFSDVSQSRLSDPLIASLLKPPIERKSKVVQPVLTPIPEVLRFDISPSFVAQRWPRVSTNLPDLNYHGMRVPVLTGTRPEDLHGSASYFFNRSHQLVRIGLHGYTDDPEPVIQFVTSTYRLREYAATGQRLFLAYYKGQPLSMLRIRRAELGKDNSIEVILEVNAPAEGAALSEESFNYLTSLRDANLL
ncbi:DUF6690 family protein [Planctomycetota bacterium]